jgi:hypothetical protein
VTALNKEESPMSPDTPAPAGAKPYKRHILIINKAFQYKFVSVVMGCVAFAVAIIAVDMFTSLGNYVVGVDVAPDPAAVYRDSWIALAVKVIVYMTGVFVVSLSVSHKIAGPVYRFEKSCEAVALGNLAYRAFIRKGDEWEGFRESFNGMVEALQKKAADDVARAQAAKKLLEEMAADGALPEGARAKARQALAEVSAVGSKFKLT